MNARDRRLLAAFQSLPFEWGAGRRWCLERLRRHEAFPVTAKIFGHLIRIHADNPSERKFLVQPHVYNAREFRFLIEHLPHDDGVFVDIGANAGVYAFAVAARCGADTRILCIEPNPTMLDRLETNLWHLNDFASAGVDVAIDRRGVAEATRAAKLATDRGLGAAALTDAEDGLGIEVAPLTTILDEHAIDVPHVLKIDIEGFEDRALLPFFETSPPRRWPQAMVVEHCSRRGWRTDLVGALRGRGYVQRGRTRNNLLLERAG